MFTRKNVYIYRSSNMPDEGWLHSCFHCYAITSHLLRIKKKMTFNAIYNVEVYVCLHCRKNLSENDDLYATFYKRCKMYMKRNIQFY